MSKRSGCRKFRPYNNDLICDVCVTLCLSKAGKLRHMRNHRNRAPTNYKMPENSCHFSGKVCKPVVGLKILVSTLQNRPNNNKMYVYKLCGIDFKSLFDIKNHIRSKHRVLQDITCVCI